MKTAVKKYIRPKSLTFWAGAVPLIGGLLIAFSKAVPQLAPIADVAEAVFGTGNASVLINGGIAAIGLRAAVSDK